MFNDPTNVCCRHLNSPIGEHDYRRLDSRCMQLPSWPSSRRFGDRIQRSHSAQLRVIRMVVACRLMTEIYTDCLAESFVGDDTHRLRVQSVKGTIMRLTSWFESLRRQFGSVTGAKSRRHGRDRTRRLTTALVESLEDRCLLAAGEFDPSFGVGGVPHPARHPRNLRRPRQIHPHRLTLPNPPRPVAIRPCLADPLRGIRESTK